MGSPRKFWLTLFNQKRIDAAWVAFSDAGAALARRKAGNRAIHLAVKLRAAIVQARVFSSSRSEERSSSKDRATTRSISSDERNPRAPKLYQHSYDCDAIRRIPGAQAKMHLGHWEGWVLERI